MRRHVGRAIGHGISPVVEGLDINAIVHQIDVQELLDQVDLNDVLARVDLNELLDKVDLNRQLHRVDMNKLLANVDINAIIERSDLENIIARSSSGFCGKFIFLARTHLARWDQAVQRCARCACCSEEPWMPPLPGMPYRTKRPWPKSTNKFGKDIQFRCAGFTTRLMAWFIDNFFLACTFAIFVWIVEKIIEQFPNLEGNATAWFFAYGIVFYEFCYSTLMISCLGRTVGLWILGLLVVQKDGHKVHPLQIVFRSLMSWLNLITFGLVGIVRRDGRMLHDLIACTCVVYAWDSSAARIKIDRNNDFAVSIGDMKESTLMASTFSHEDVENPESLYHDAYEGEDDEGNQTKRRSSRKRNASL